MIQTAASAPSASSGNKCNSLPQRSPTLKPLKPGLAPTRTTRSSTSLVAVAETAIDADGKSAVQAALYPIGADVGIVTAIDAAMDAAVATSLRNLRASAVTVARLLVLQLRTTRGPPDAAQVIQDIAYRGLESALPIRQVRTLDDLHRPG